MPLGHQGSKWPAGAELPQAGAHCGAAAVAAVPVLTRSTVAALLREAPPQQQLEDARRPCRPPAGAEERSWVSEGTDEPAGAAPSYAPAYRPWTAVRRVIDEVGRQAGAPLASHRQPGQPGAAGAAPPAWDASADSTSTVAMPWDRPTVLRSAGGMAGVAQQPAGACAQRSMRRPPRPPSSHAGAAAAPMQAGRQAAQPRARLPPPLPPPPVRHAVVLLCGMPCCAACRRRLES